MCFYGDMGSKEFLKNMFVKLGENNKPTYAVMAIAFVKGIARPIFTMTDKHADPETKKYTALREGLTEIVAIPTYFVCGELASKIGESLNLPKQKQALAKKNFMFLGVCTAALIIIPALASAVIKPFMNKIQSKKTAVEPIGENSLTPKQQTFKGKKLLLNCYSRGNLSCGMKVGGV